LNDLPQEERKRIIETVVTFYKLVPHQPLSADDERPEPVSLATASRPPISFSEDLSLTPKDFLLEKQPQTDVERVTCLAYYLTHYRDTPYFKTLDISKLNTEAAQRKFSNSTLAIENAVRQGYLVEAARGQRQISGFGEQYVRALPDRDSAREIMGKMMARRRSRKKVKETPQSE
jgi:hypothetical protein